MIKLDFDVEATKEEAERYHEIISAMLRCGALSGVKGGKTILHFDALGIFQGVELDYWPWRRRKEA